jgi:hypothetical protein
MGTGDTGNAPSLGSTSSSKDGKEGKKGSWQHGSKATAISQRQPKFEGKCDELKGHIFDCSDVRQADLFAKTCKEIAEYVGRNYKYGGDARLIVENLARPILPEPEDPPEKASATKKRIWEKQVDAYVLRQTHIEEHIKSLYSLVWGQCTDIMRQKLEAFKGFDDISSAGDGIRLLEAIKTLTYNYQSQKYLPHAIHETKRRFYTFGQGKSSTVYYHEQFLNIVEVLDTIKAPVGIDAGLFALVAEEKKKTVEQLTDTEHAEVREWYLATAFMLGADRARFGKLLENMENDFLQGRNSYPRSVTAAFNLLINWKQDPRNLVRSVGVTNDGVSFTNTDGIEDSEVDVTLNNNAKKKPKDISKVKCRRCGEMGHYPTNCDGVRLARPEPSSDASTDSSNSGVRQSGATMLLLSSIANGEFDEDDLNLTTGFQFLAFTTGTVPKSTTGNKALPITWILLDNQSTVDVFCNASLLQNIRTSDSFMDIHCNAGVTSTNLIGDLPGYGTVWYHPNGIANILSLSRVREHGFQVTYDSHLNCFRITKSDGSVRVFHQSKRGLYYMSTQPHNDFTLVNTVADNRARYNNRDYSRAVFARKLQGIIGRPSTRQFKSILQRHQLPNCPVNLGDVAAAEDIFGPDIGSLKGKTVRKATPHAPSQLIPVPLPILKQYRNITLAGDVLHVNRIPFFVTISHHLRFCTSEMVTNQQAPTLLASIKQVRSFYAHRGFCITTIVLDGQFESLRGDLADLHMALQTCGQDDHVPVAERHIRTLKDRARALYNSLPFQRLPARMVIELIYYCTFWLNAFPHPDGVSADLSPREIVSGLGLDFTKHCRIEFGAYAQVHEDHDNTMAPRTTGAIALRPTGNAHGSYYFYHLNTGRVLNRSRWTELPMPDDVAVRALNSSLAMADLSSIPMTILLLLVLTMTLPPASTMIMTMILLTILHRMMMPPPTTSQECMMKQDMKLQTTIMLILNNNPITTMTTMMMMMPNMTMRMPPTLNNFQECLTTTQQENLRKTNMPEECLLKHNRLQECLLTSLLRRFCLLSYLRPYPMTTPMMKVTQCTET